MGQTLTTFTTAVLEELGAVGSGQTPSAEDVTKVETRLPGILATLNKQRICYVPDTDDIPDELFDHLVEFVTEICAPAFGRPQDRAAKAEAEARMRTVSRIGGGTGGTLKLDPALTTRGGNVRDLF